MEVGLPQFEIQSIEGTETVEIRARYVGPVRCPVCQGDRPRFPHRVGLPRFFPAPNTVIAKLGQRRSPKRDGM